MHYHLIMCYTNLTTSVVQLCSNTSLSCLFVNNFMLFHILSSTLTLHDIKRKIYVTLRNDKRFCTVVEEMF